MLLGAPFFNYVVDIYFCYANFLSKTSCVNFAIIRNVEKLLLSEKKCLREFEISVIPLYFSR